MRAEGLITRQRVDPAKAERAKELRRQMTPEERLLWERLRGNRLGGLHFRRQQVIGGFIVDFYCHSARLVVEVDGCVHKGRRAADRERDALLAARGLKLVRFDNTRVREDMDGVLEEILRASKG